MARWAMHSLLVMLAAAMRANASAIYQAGVGVEEESIAALSGPRTIPARLAAAPVDRETWWAGPIGIDLTAGEIPHALVGDPRWALSPMPVEPLAGPGSAPSFPVDWLPLVEVGEPATLTMISFALLILLAQRRPRKLYYRYRVVKEKEQGRRG